MTHFCDGNCSFVSDAVPRQIKTDQFGVWGFHVAKLLSEKGRSNFCDSAETELQFGKAGEEKRRARLASRTTD